VAGTTSTGGATLNLKQVALRLGVHYMTAYRYVRQGRLPARQDGTSWVVDEADVVRFLEERDGSPAGAGADERPRVDWSERVRVQLAMGNEVEAWAVVEQALASGVTPQRAFLDLLGGTVAEIGSQVDAGEASTADLHIATSTAQRVAVRLGARFRRRRRSRGTVVLGAPPGELHDLPIALIADLLRLDAYSVLELGADVPPEAFAVAAERAERPAVVGLGVTRIDHIDAAREVVAAVRRAAPDVPVLVGGQAVRSAEVAAVLGVDAWADGETITATVERLMAP
jgi:excisionase family DNA binding protein